MIEKGPNGEKKVIGVQPTHKSLWDAKLSEILVEPIMGKEYTVTKGHMDVSLPKQIFGEWLPTKLFRPDKPAEHTIEVYKGRVAKPEDVGKIADSPWRRIK